MLDLSGWFPGHHAAIVTPDPNHPRHVALWAQVAPRLPRAELAHDAAHVLRVYHWCLRLAPELGADTDLAGAAGLVHDLVAIPKDHPDRPLGGERSAAAAGGLLAAAGYDRDETAAVVEAVRTCSWSRGLAATGPLGQVLQDADRLDAIGAWGIARSVSTGQHMARADSGSAYHHPDDPWFRSARALDDRRYVLDHCFAKVLHLAHGMHSPSARAEGLRRHAFVLQFIGELAFDRGPAPAVLFDFDGTLVDSAPGIMGCLRHALAHIGIADPVDERLRAMIGLPLGPSFRICWGVDAAAEAEAVRVYREHWLAWGAAQASIYEGVPDLLAALAAAGRPLVVATAKNSAGVHTALQRVGLGQWFHAAVGSEPGEADKRGVVARALASLPGHARDGALLVGDRRADAEAAAANHIGFIAADWGYSAEGEWQGLDLAGRAASAAELQGLLLQPQGD